MTSPNSNDSFLLWDPAQVSNFIGSSIDKSTGSLFLNNNLDGLLLPYLTTEHLRELGIEKLNLRLQVKRVIAELVHKHQQESTTSAPININNNYLHVESLSLALALLRESFNKISLEQQQLHQFQIQQLQLRQQQQQQQFQQQFQQQMAQQVQHLSAPSSPSQQQIELQRLHENLNKLKSELIPAMRLIKESKPLPTPTLDPGSTIHNLDSPTFSVLSSNTFADLNMEKDRDRDRSNTSTRRNSLGATVVAAGTAAAAAPLLLNTSLISNGLTANSNPGTGSATLNNSISNPSLNGASRMSSMYPPSSPTLATNRYSSGSVLSMGTGKVVSQSIVQESGPSNSNQNVNERRNNFTLQKVTNRINSNGNRPRLIETRTSSSSLSKGMRPNSGGSLNTSPPGNGSSNATGFVTTSTNTLNSAAAAAPLSTPSVTPGATEPLKQLRASSDDSCLKILQQAMKRHHIPRDDWLKYVLVICYGDKERILKLAEKPVIIFKELQELGKHPAIMLRQLATSREDEESVMYEDLRIGDDIPGGTL